RKTSLEYYCRGLTPGAKAWARPGTILGFGCTCAARPGRAAALPGSIPSQIPSVARSVLTTFVALCLSLCAPAVWSQAQRLPVVKLNIGSHTLSAEVAATAESRRYGLMHRQQLPDNHGMLFVFDHDDTY